MTFRDDREAKQARIAALEDDLAAARADAEAARKEAAEARKQADRARQPRPRRERKDAGETSNSAFARTIAVSLGAGVIGVGYLVWSMYRSHGWPIPHMAGIEERLPGCSCTFADGRAVQLGVRVNAAEIIQSPGKPWKMGLAWSAYGAGQPLRLTDPQGALDVAPPQYAQEQLSYGYVIDVGLACVGADRLVVASRGNVTTWDLGAREILQKDRFEVRDPTFLSGRRMELRCSALSVRGDTVTVPSENGDVSIRVPSR